MTHPRPLAFRLFGATAFALAVGGIGIVVASDAVAGELPVEVKKPPAAAAEKPEVKPGAEKPSPPPKKQASKKKRIDFGKYEGY